MKIEKMDFSNLKYKKDLATLLRLTWSNSYEESAEEEVESFSEENRVSLMASENDELIGFVGAIPQYEKTGWELHPLVVKKESQHSGLGTLLLAELEKEVAKRGGLTIYLGSDDEKNQTSLSNTDLFENTFEKLQNIKNFDRHPYEFYQKNGYQIVGVFPDVNGLGKPDIWLAKRIVKV